MFNLTDLYVTFRLFKEEQKLIAMKEKKQNAAHEWFYPDYCVFIIVEAKIEAKIQ